MHCTTAASLEMSDEPKTIITITKKGSLPQTPLPLYKILATTGATNKRTPLEKQQEFHIAH